MKLRPLGWRVLVKPVTLEEDAAMPEFLKHSKFQIKAGLDINDERRAKVALEQGVIVAIGGNAFRNKEWGYDGSPDWVPPVSIGMKVWFGKYAGKLVPDPEDGVEYMLLLDEDLQCEIGE